MNWTEATLRTLVSDMAAENPLACKALLDISKIEFTETVPTMAISLSKRPVLRINLEFCRAHLRTESEVKCVLLHEFLHVLLFHHLSYTYNTPLLNIALDAVINAIIHRIKGPEYSDFFIRFYPWTMPSMLLRPRPYAKNEYRSHGAREQWLTVHEQLYAGRMTADDLLERLTAPFLNQDIVNADSVVVLGNHDHPDNEFITEKVISGIIRQVGGLNGIVRQAWPIEAEKTGKSDWKKYRVNKWRAQAMAALRRCVVPDRRNRPSVREGEALLPVLSTSDRRAAMRFLNSNLLPFAHHPVSRFQPAERCVVYLDVSGSMSEELGHLVQLLGLLRPYIRMPLYAFSTDVVPARFTKGVLEIKSTGGTAIEPVFNHIRQHNFRRALIISDGYVESISSAMLSGLDRRQIHVLLSAKGSPHQFEENGIRYRQLPTLENE